MPPTRHGTQFTDSGCEGDQCYSRGPGNANALMDIGSNLESSKKFDDEQAIQSTRNQVSLTLWSGRFTPKCGLFFTFDGEYEAHVTHNGLMSTSGPAKAANTKCSGGSCAVIFEGEAAGFDEGFEMQVNDVLEIEIKFKRKNSRFHSIDPRKWLDESASCALFQIRRSETDLGSWSTDYTMGKNPKPVLAEQRRTQHDTDAYMALMTNPNAGHDEPNRLSLKLSVTGSDPVPSKEEQLETAQEKLANKIENEAVAEIEKEAEAARKKEEERLKEIEARRKAFEEAKEEARLKAEEEEKKALEAAKSEARRKAEEEALRVAEEEANRKADEARQQALRKAEEQAHRQAEQNQSDKPAEQNQSDGTDSSVQSETASASEERRPVKELFDRIAKDKTMITMLEWNAWYKKNKPKGEALKAATTLAGKPIDANKLLTAVRVDAPKYYTEMADIGRSAGKQGVTVEVFANWLAKKHHELKDITNGELFFDCKVADFDLQSQVAAADLKASCKTEAAREQALREARPEAEAEREAEAVREQALREAQEKVEAAKKKAEEEAVKQARQAAEEARKQAEEEALRRAEEEAKDKADEACKTRLINAVKTQIASGSIHSKAELKESIKGLSTGAMAKQECLDECRAVGDEWTGSYCSVKNTDAPITDRKFISAAIGLMSEFTKMYEGRSTEDWYKQSEAYAFEECAKKSELLKGSPLLPKGLAKTKKSAKKDKRSNQCPSWTDSSNIAKQEKKCPPPALCNIAGTSFTCRMVVNTETRFVVQFRDPSNSQSPECAETTEDLKKTFCEGRFYKEVMDYEEVLKLQNEGKRPKKDWYGKECKEGDGDDHICHVSGRKAQVTRAENEAERFFCALQ